MTRDQAVAINNAAGAMVCAWREAVRRRRGMTEFHGGPDSMIVPEDMRELGRAIMRHRQSIADALVVAMGGPFI